MDFGLTLARLPAAEMLAVARQAETWGYTALYVPDHLAFERQDGSGTLDDEMPTWEATTILGAIASSTTKVRIGALVLCNLFRHPATTAQATTTLDHLSAGRALLGIGAGWTKAEFAMAGLPFPDVTTRLRMLDEAVRVIKEVWTSERATFAGEFYHLHDAISVPKPLQRPRPPILLGGSGKGLLRIAAREADVVNIVSDTGRTGGIDRREVAKLTDESFRAKVGFVRAEARAAGRDPATLTISSTVFITMLADSSAAARAFAGNVGSVFALTADDVLRMPLALIGTPDECAAELRRREREWGVSHYVFSGPGGAAFAERFANEVMPRLA